MKRIIVILVLVFICFGLAGCAGSRVHTARFEIDPGKGKISVMPWAKVTHSRSANDAFQRSTMTLGAIGALASPHEAVDKKTGMFTYTFDKGDYANLRQSVIQSLQKSEAFSEVIDVSDAPPPDDDLRLVMAFYESGIVQTPATSKCILRGLARVVRGTADTVKPQIFDIEATSLLSVSGAKSKAMKMYLAQMGELLKSVE